MSEQKGFQPIPEGEYLARMNRYEVVPTKSGGTMIKTGFQIVNGDYKDRLVFKNFVIDHANAKVREISNKQLDDYLKAAGYKEGYESKDPTVLDKALEMPVLIAVKIQAGKDGYKDSNDIKKFKAR